MARTRTTSTRRRIGTPAERLKSAGADHAEATLKLEAARTDLYAEIRRARGAEGTGLSIRAISEAASVSIGMVQDALKDAT